jgi:hypothetical protein
VRDNVYAGKVTERRRRRGTSLLEALFEYYLDSGLSWPQIAASVGGGVSGERLRVACLRGSARPFLIRKIEGFLKRVIVHA